MLNSILNPLIEKVAFFFFLSNFNLAVKLYVILNTHVYYDKYSKYEIIPTSKGLNSKTNISVVWG